MWNYNHTNNLQHNFMADKLYCASEYNDELYHYGILGMKWGIRKERPSSGLGKGRKKLSAAQKQKIKKIAIGAGIGTAAAGAAVGTALLARKGIKKNIAYKNGLKNGFGSYQEIAGHLPSNIHGRAVQAPAVIRNHGSYARNGLRNVGTALVPRNKSKVLRNLAIGVGATAATAGAGYGGYKGYQQIQKKKKRN